MKAILVSKRFNPGHISHIEANAQLLESQGFEVQLDVHRKFLAFANSCIADQQAKPWGSVRLRKGDLFIIWFPSVLVVLNLILVKLLTQATIVYVYHEPYTSFASYRSAGFSWLKTARVTLIAAVSEFISALSDKVILPSTRAFDAIAKAKAQPYRYAKINLMFSDETNESTQNLARQFVAYIGTIAEDHAFDEFLHLVEASIAGQKLPNLKFLIATRSHFSDKHQAIIDQCIATGRLVVQSGEPMTNRQINKFYAESFVVWNAYKRSMQSGVLPKAYMFGTPVLVSVTNQSEYFENGVHGVLISDRYGFDEFEQAVITLQSNWSTTSQNCRSHYLQNFDYRALSGTFINFVLD